MLQCHKSLQISATYSIQKPERSSWQKLFQKTKIVIYQLNKTNETKILSRTNKVKEKIVSKENKIKTTSSKQTMYMARAAS